LENAGAAAAHPGPALEGVRLFFLATLRDRERFVLPLHGGPAIFTPAARQRRADVRTVLRALLERGQAAGELRADLTPEDLIVTTSLLSRPLPGTGDRDALARRQIDLMIDGLAPDSRRRPDNDQLRQFAAARRSAAGGRGRTTASAIPTRRRPVPTTAGSGRRSPRRAIPGTAATSGSARLSVPAVAAVTWRSPETNNR
jgi:hypothetical protein